jgi:hypothetical protein
MVDSNLIYSANPKYNPKTDQENLSIDQEILEKIKDLIILVSIS